MAKIDRVEDLPEWFSLEYYRGTESFGAIEWYEQIAQRRGLMTLLGYRSDEPSRARKAAAIFARFAEKIRGVAIREAKIPGFFGEAGLYHNLATGFRSVESLTLNHLLGHARFSKGGNLTEPIDWWASSLDQPGNDKAMSKPLFLADFLSIDRERFAAVRIDLDAPDAIILESFTLQLAEMRALKGQPYEKKFYRPNFQRWARYGILPYIDLLIWAKETESHIPDRVMSAAISVYDAGESNIRKTIAPLAESLIADASELRALAEIEAAKRETLEP